MVLAYTFKDELWAYFGDGSWYFITLPVKYADEIKTIASSIKKGFGSVKVSATIGSTSWNTSIFPDVKSKSYVLPIKKDVRIANHISVGDKPKVYITIKDIQ